MKTYRLTTSQRQLIDLINQGNTDTFSEQLRREKLPGFIFYQKIDKKWNTKLTKSKNWPDKTLWEKQTHSTTNAYFSPNEPHYTELSSLSITLNRPIIYTHTLLSWAIEQKQLKIIKAIIGHEASRFLINFSINGVTPLAHSSVLEESAADIVTMLLAAGADPTALIFDREQEKSLLEYLLYKKNVDPAVIENLIFSGLTISDIDKEQLQGFAEESFNLSLLNLSSALYYLKAGENARFIRLLNESYAAAPEIITKYFQYLIVNIEYPEEQIEYNAGDYCYNYLRKEHINILLQSILGLWLANGRHRDISDQLSLFAEAAEYIYKHTGEPQVDSNLEQFKLAANFAQFAFVNDADIEKKLISCCQILNKQNDEIGVTLTRLYETNKQQLLEFIADRQLDAIKLFHDNELERVTDDKALIIFAQQLLDEKQFLGYAHELKPLVMIRLAHYLKELNCIKAAQDCFAQITLKGQSAEVKQLYIELFHAAHKQLPAMGEMTKQQMGSFDLWVKTKFNSQEKPIKKTVYLPTDQPSFFTDTIAKVTPYASNAYQKNGFYTKLSFKGDDKVTKADELLAALNDMVKPRQ